MDDKWTTQEKKDYKDELKHIPIDQLVMKLLFLSDYKKSDEFKLINSEIKKRNKS